MSFHELFSLYSPEVTAFAHFLCGDRALAEDLCQETFVRAWTARGEIRQQTVKAYLLTITRNLFRDHLRRHRKMEQLPTVAGPELPALQLITQAEELAGVMQAMQNWDPSDRQALLWFARDELSFDEIASRLGCSSAAAKQRIYRARKKLNLLRKS